VPGEALTAVVIDRIPFPHVDDPVIKALCEGDPQGFDRVILPRAITMLRQGVGRLIRSRLDVGVVVLLDRRVAEHAYGTRILDSLPPMRTTRRLENITRFLEDAERAAA
jgi:ATP-dependent DNA helicase DinG